MTEGRKLVHLRHIECAGYERGDGLFEIEGTLIDTKPTDLVLPEKPLPANTPIHRMKVCIAVDKDFVIREIRADTLDAPYRVCGRIGPAYAQLVGHRIEAGFTMKVKRMFRGIEGCSHLTELLPAMATTVFQVIWADSGNFDNSDLNGVASRGSPLGGCHALRLDGEVVMKYFAEAAREEP
ncbi:MAG: DUF2889 domain-containing protein, partial [Comamonadaceae bacterium]